MNCTSVVCKFTKSSDFARANQARFSVSCWQDGEQIFFHYFSFSSKNVLPTPDSTSSSSNQNLEGDLPLLSRENELLLLSNVFHVTSRNQGSFLKVAYVASVSVWFGAKIRTGFGRARNETRARGGRLRGREERERTLRTRLGDDFLPRIQRPVFMLFARGTSILNNEGSRGQI